MSKKGNFAQALKELTGFDESADRAADKATETADAEQNRSSWTADSTWSDFKEMYTGESAGAHEHSPAIPTFDFHVTGEDSTQITKNMTVTGDIQSNDDLIVDGRIFGNVTTSGNLSMSNLVVGDLKACNISLTGARVKGDVSLDGNLRVEESTIIVGDVTGNSVKVSGKIKGNLDLEDMIVLTSDAFVSGNILASNILTESGARINGSVSTRNTGSDYDVESEFDLGVDFDE